MELEIDSIVYKDNVPSGWILISKNHQCENE